MTKIDIILPYYNGSQYFEEQLRSIQESHLEGIDLNLIIINDCSSQAESDFLKKILPANALYIENEKNLGVTKSVEKGLRSSYAPYVMFCDQDDVWLPHKIKNSLQKIRETEMGDSPALVYTDLVITDSNLQQLHPSMHEYYNHNHGALRPSVLFHNIVTGCSVILNRRLVDIGLPFPDLITMHDHWFALCATFTGKVSFLNEPTILYRQHGNNQVGAPNRSATWKILNFRVTIPKFKKHLKLKIGMASELEERLQCIGRKVEADFMKKVVTALKRKDILFLINSKVISGPTTRILGTCALLMLISKGEE